MLICGFLVAVQPRCALCHLFSPWQPPINLLKIDGNIIFQKIIYFKVLSPFAHYRAWDSPMAIKGTRSRAAVCHMAEQNFDDTIPLQPDRKPDIPEPLLCCCFNPNLDRFHPLFKSALRKMCPACGYRKWAQQTIRSKAYRLNSYSGLSAYELNSSQAQ